MFDNFKKKISEAINQFSKKAELESEGELKEKKDEEYDSIEVTKKNVAIQENQKSENQKPELKLDEENSLEEEYNAQEKKGMFKKLRDKISTVKISNERFEDLFFDLELVLLENNVAVEVVEKIKEDIKDEIVNKEISKKNLKNVIVERLKQTIEEILTFEKINIVKEIKEKNEKSKQPYVIAFFGINGSGKTTSLAKIAYLLKKNKISCVFAASDTFRAAAIQQLEEHAKSLNVKLIKHDYGSDPTAVAFDAVKYAEAKKVDCVLIDTAGRLHSNTNLMNQLQKLNRVINPDLRIFVGESLTGNDCIEQAKIFNETINLHGIILTKADVDERGGTAISISYIIKKPILYLGTGQNYEDLSEFNKDELISKLFSDISQ